MHLYPGLTWCSLTSCWTLTLSSTGQHLPTGRAIWERPREEPLRPQNALSVTSDWWVWSLACISCRNRKYTCSVELDVNFGLTSSWQMESCILAHLLISWGGILPFSGRLGIITQSERNSTIQDGWTVKYGFIRLQTNFFFFNVLNQWRTGKRMNTIHNKTTNSQKPKHDQISNEMHQTTIITIIILIKDIKKKLKTIKLFNQLFHLRKTWINNIIIPGL